MGHKRQHSGRQEQSPEGAARGRARRKPRVCIGAWVVAGALALGAAGRATQARAQSANAVATPAPNPMSPSLAAPQSPLAIALRQAVVGYGEQLGALETWQRKIFDDEIVPQAPRFVRSYRDTGGGTYQVEVDRDLVRRYLSFYAPQVLGVPQPRMGLYVWADPACGAPCQSAIEPVARLLKARSERRGFAVVWLTAADLGGATSADEPLEQAATRLAQERKLDAVAVLQWREQAVEAIDAAHSEERARLVRSYWWSWRRDRAAAQGPDGLQAATAAALGLAGRELKVSVRDSVGASESLELGCQKLMNDAFVSLGDQWTEIRQAERDERSQELWITLKGPQPYAVFDRWRALVRDRLAGLGVVEDRAYRRSRLTLALVGEGEGALKQAQSLLAGATIDGRGLAFSAVNASEMECELR